MVTRRCLLPLLALVFAACASTAPSPSPAPARAIPNTASASSDARELGSALSEAYAQAVARDANPKTAVDLEAAASMPLPDHPSVRSAINLFSKSMRGDIQTFLTRSGTYKSMIDKTLAEAGLPKGLAYLPVIESGYSPTLTSRVGARGVWQFMPDTAREYGLRVDWWIDERADPERSTRAAAQYLKDLYRQFNDWALTLAAYNAGPGRIQRALKSNGVSTFWDLTDLGAIPKETRGYVPTFYATLAIASDPDTYGFRLGEPREDDWKRVEVEGPVSLKYLAQVARVDEQQLVASNPAIRRAVLPPGRSSVRLPAQAAESIAAQATTLRRDDPEIEICSFTLRSGDSLSRLARAIGTSVDTILSMNDLRSPSSVREGTSLYLPVRARELGALLAHSEDETIYYAVRRGDTLYSIAKRHNLTVDELREINELDRGESLRTGQKLRVTAPRALTAGGM